MDLDRLKQQLAEFADARDWQGFHSPKNLAMALAAESGELLELFQWLSEEQSALPAPELRQAAAHELADVFIYLVRLADALDIELETAVAEKMLINAENYPVELARGNATKYNRRD